jgi:hypothetical protein
LSTETLYKKAALYYYYYYCYHHHQPTLVILYTTLSMAVSSSVLLFLQTLQKHSTAFLAVAVSAELPVGLRNCANWQHSASVHCWLAAIHSHVNRAPFVTDSGYWVPRTSFSTALEYKIRSETIKSLKLYFNRIQTFLGSTKYIRCFTDRLLSRQQSTVLSE